MLRIDETVFGFGYVLINRIKASARRISVVKMSGQGEIRTRDLYNANVTIFQLIYLPSG